jgi:ABC-type Mn2+/Zn2+ transport system ATPase subunit
MIKFTKIENGSIFTRDFNPLVKNNEISFPANSEEIAVVYGPNGAGKSSLVKVLSDVKSTKLEFQYDGNSHKSGQAVFHVISDQNGRNIIAGETKDFLLGDNISREYELQSFIASERERIISAVVALLKNNHGISAASSPLIGLVDNTKIAELIKDIANNKSKGKNYSDESLVSVLGIFSVVPLTEYEEIKLQFLKTDISSAGSVIMQIENLAKKVLVANSQVRQIEENTEAIKILNRFQKDQCIVCDTDDIDWKSLLTAKTANRSMVYAAMNEDIRILVEKIIAIVPDNDPFLIKELLLEAINKGDKSIIDNLLPVFNSYKKLYSQLIINDVAELYSKSEFAEKIAEYQKLVDEKPEITEEDLLYIREIISNSMDKPLELERDDKKNLKIKLQGQDFLGINRDSLPLSAGEQNFLSLTFEFLKAKKVTTPVVVIDDPISSFDSIYKNKIVYAIVKMLHDKKRIILTHNTDLIRLLESQYNKCYKLFLLNNTDGEENGFIPLKMKEQDILINLEKLLLTFREKIFSHIKDMNLFLISMIPFMRGYATIFNKTTESEKLSQLMHGYKTEKIDVADIYTSLFGDGNGIIPATYEITVDDILSKTVDAVHILDNAEYPLLDKTLRHSFTYLFLRLMVEKALVQKFNINTNEKKKLGQIISAAYPDENDITQIRNRIRLTSKKTLINEFNHFEGNLSIFQPAIDITDQALGKERTDIVTFIRSL